MSVHRSGVRQASVWCLWPTLTISWIAFAQVLSLQGLVVWVIGGSIITAGVVLTLGWAGRPMLGAAAGGILTITVPLLAEALGGNTSGPIARSSLMACGTIAAACLIVRTQYPAGVLVCSLLLLGGALGLGAADRVLWLSGPWAVAAAFTLAVTGEYRVNQLADRTRTRPLASLLTGLGLVAVGCIVVLNPLMASPWTIPSAREVAVPAFIPVVAPVLVPVREPTPISTASATPAPLDIGVHEAVKASGSPADWLMYLLPLLVILVGVSLLRRAWAAAQWVLLRRRLMTGNPEQRLFGAWTWVRLRRERYDWPLPVSVSPDVAGSWAESAYDRDVAVVGDLTSLVAFNPSGVANLSEAKRAWDAALRAGAAPAEATVRQRWRWAARRPQRSSPKSGPALAPAKFAAATAATAGESESHRSSGRRASR